MSHFTVTVIGEDVEEQLAQYQENNMGDCPQKYLEFNDIEAESREDYETVTTSVFIDTEGVAHCKYSGQFKNTGEYVCPDGWTENEDYPVNKLYEDFDTYMTDYCGYEKDDVIGKYGYWENPNAKWDWYQVGGRWAGMLKIKPEYQELYLEERPNFSWGWDMDEKSKEEKRKIIEQIKVDSALKKHIDFDGIMDEAGEEARKDYRKVMSFVKKYDDGSFMGWNDHFLPMVQDEDTDYTITQAREDYHNQQLLKSKSKHGKDEDISVWINFEDYIKYTEEEFVDLRRKESIMTFAILKDGKWAERGEMGWWGCVSGEKDQETWESIFHNILDSTGDDERITIVDCHI